MSLSNTTEVAALAMFLQGQTPPIAPGATQYLALFTADPTESASLAAEADYTGYARVALTKATAWTGGGNPFTNAALIQFGACTAGTNALTHFAVVDTSSGAVSMLISGALSSTLNVSAGIQPQFAAGALSVAAD
jgi:hypothetical protein